MVRTAKVDIDVIMEIAQQPHAQILGLDQDEKLLKLFLSHT